MKQHIIFISAFFLVCSLSFPGYASFEDRASGARPAALAGAYGASSGDIFGIPYNPAGFSQLGSPKLGISLFRIFQLADFSTFFAAFSLPLGNNRAIGICEQFFGTPGYYSENTFSCSYSRQIFRFREQDSINAGVSLSYLHKAMINSSDNHLLTKSDGFGVDAGLLVISQLLPILNIKAGFAYHKKEIENIPDLFETALSLLLLKRFSTSLDYELAGNAFRIGEEVALFHNALFLRAGMVSGGFSSGEKDLGFGWVGKGLAIDYALQIFPDDLDLTHKFSIGIDF